ncbi:MAG: T9SS type A sorting domain-containing protein [Calditrichaeota bacterium]|nr:T9SS type A sorting domain-containing protein [Calditrichota bacterium]
MKYKVFIMACFLVIAVLGSALAQDTLVVSSGLGTLNDAITAKQGNVVYKLETEGYYLLNAPIENNGFDLVIVGPKYSDTTKPAVIQTGTLADGAVMSQMFSVLGDLTLKNVYIVNASLSGQIANGILTQKAKSKVVFDNCIVDPIGTGWFSTTNVDSCDIFITNCKLLRSGSTSAINDGPMINLMPTFYVDSLYFENNTLVSSGTWFTAAHTNPTIVNFTWINHNTFVFHKSQLDWVSYENQYYLTNNLFFDFMTSPYLYDWDQYFEPFVDGTHLNLIWADTLEMAGGEPKPGDTAGLKFSPTAAFTSIGPVCPSWGDSEGNLTLKLYKWDTDYATTIAAAPIAEETFVNFADNAALWMSFDEQQPGDYLWQLSGATQTVGVWKWTDAPEAVTSYFNGQATDGQYRFRIIDGSGDHLFTNGVNQVPVQLKPGESGKHYEPLPSQRVQFIEYNLFYTQQMFKDFAQMTMDVDSIPDGYIMPLLQPYPEVITREGPMFADDANWPNFIYGNTIDDQDPQWTDDQIYTVSQAFYEWDIPASYVHWGLDPGTTPNQWPTSWYWDLDGDPGNPEAWPVFDGTYKNPVLLTGSIEKLPLGDLNWFPEAKAVWEANQDAIADHIKSLSTEKIDVGTGVETGRYQPAVYQLSQNYPNPFNPVTTIYYSLKKSDNINLTVYNMLGQKVRTLVDERMSAGKHAVKWDGKDDLARQMSSGVYFYMVKSGPFSKTMKMLLMK